MSQPSDPNHEIAGDVFDRLLIEHPEHKQALKSVAGLEGEPFFLGVLALPEAVATDLLNRLRKGSGDQRLAGLLSTVAGSRAVVTNPLLKHLATSVLAELHERVSPAGGVTDSHQVQLAAQLAIVCYYQRDYDAIDALYVLHKPDAKGALDRHQMILLMYKGLALAKKRYFYDAIRLYDRALSSAKDLGAKDYLGRIYDCLGRAYGEKGRFKEAFGYFDLSVAAKREVGDLEGLAITFGNQGRLHINAGDFDAALEAFNKDLEISGQIRDPVGQIIMQSQIGELFLSGGRLEEARQSYQTSLEMAQGNANRLSVGFALVGLAECALAADDDATFELLLSQLTAEFGKGQPQVDIQGLMDKLLGSRADKAERLEEAERHYRLSISRREARISPIERGLIEERLGLLRQRAGDSAAAERLFKRAITRFTEANALYYASRLQGRLKDANLAEWLIYVFRGFLGPEIIDLITQGKPAAEHIGERKFTSVLFSDIRGFTTFSEGMAPEDLVETLNDYLSGMTDVIEQHHGGIDKYIGDAIMAVFTVRQTQADTAVNAVLAASDMLKELYMFNRVLADRGKPPINCGVGIHSGDVVAGTMGSSSRKNYTVLGDVVNTGSRIEGLTKKYGVQVLVSGETLALCRDDPRLHFREVDTVRMKGKDLPVVVHELVKVGTLSGGKQRALAAYHDALASYQRRDFASALAGFSELVAGGKGPKLLLDLYQKRSRAYLEKAPPADWDGVTTMHEK